MPKSPVLWMNLSQINELYQQAAAAPDHEICGVIGGRWRGREATATRILQVPNAAGNPQARFKMDEQHQVRAMMTVAGAGLDLVAIYHSHPHGPHHPSQTDIVECLYPDALQLIIAPDHAGDFQVTAWQIRRGHASPARIKIKSAHP